MTEKRKIRPPVDIEFEGDKCGDYCFDSFATGTGSHICSAFACLPIEKVRIRVEGNVAYRCQACLDAVKQADDEHNIAITLADSLKKNSELIILIKELVVALYGLLKQAVMLSEDYLSSFDEWSDDATIQGWDKAGWKRAIVARKAADKALKHAKEMG